MAMRHGFRSSLLCVLLLAALAWVGSRVMREHYSVYLDDSGIKSTWLGSTSSSSPSAQCSPQEEPTLLQHRKPTASFRENLRNDTSYLTTFANYGYNNQFMNILNMVYLGIMSNRIPILPPFVPNHGISKFTPVMPFGDVFDLEPLKKKLHYPLLEWRDVKVLRGTETRDKEEAISTFEKIGCWTTNPEGSTDVGQSHEMLHNLGLDVSYSRVPSTTRYKQPDADRMHVIYPMLAGLIYPDDPPLFTTDLTMVQHAHWSRHELPPDHHLSCFDSLYFAVTGSTMWEWSQNWSAVWQKIGRHLHYTPVIENLAREYLRAIFGVEDSIPPFIAVHMRHTDFSEQCSEEKIAAGACFPPVAAYNRHVEEIKREWIAKSGLTINHILVMSDDLSPALWEEVRNHGWYGVDHTRLETVQRLGEFYPIFIDSAMQSMALGIVGTTGSTFTMVSKRRIEDWNGGFGREVNIKTGQ